MVVTRGYSANHRRWDHVGNLVSNWEHSEGIRPHFHGAPAPWLPVLYYDKWYEVWATIMAGKIVGLTRDEWVVPAGLHVAWAAAGAGATIVTYTANDVTELVSDITTGQPVAAAVSYTKTQVTNALRSRGLIGAAEDCDHYISDPIGVAAHVMYSWAFYEIADMHKPDTAIALHAKFHNHYMQHQVTVLCDYALRLPHVPSSLTGVAIPGALTPGVPTFGSGNMYNATNAKSLTRYSALTGSNFIVLFVASFPVAKATTNTPITASSSSLLVRRRSSPDALVTAGDYFIDYETGVLFFFSQGGATIPATVTGTLSYYTYAAAPGTVSNYICAVGNVLPGSFLECDANSNFVVATATDFRSIMAQALTSVRHPKDYLDRVRTAYTQFGVMDAMPGTASGGYPDNLTYSGGSDKEVIINLISR